MASTPPLSEPRQAGDGVEISVRKARQGVGGRHLLWVLGISVTAVLIAFAIAFSTNSTDPVSDAPGAGGVERAADAALFNTQPATPVPAPTTP